MASYKQPCLQCGSFIERESKLCPQCGSQSPFRYQCPTCYREISKGQVVCSGCGRSLVVICPTCSQQTFVFNKCEKCGASLTTPCTNKRCGKPQFFENTICTECGKKIKK